MRTCAPPLRPPAAATPTSLNAASPLPAGVDLPESVAAHRVSCRLGVGWALDAAAAENGSGTSGSGSLYYKKSRNRMISIRLPFWGGQLAAKPSRCAQNPARSGHKPLAASRDTTPPTWLPGTTNKSLSRLPAHSCSGAHSTAPASPRCRWPRSRAPDSRPDTGRSTRGRSGAPPWTGAASAATVGTHPAAIATAPDPSHRPAPARQTRGRASKSPGCRPGQSAPAPPRVSAAG